MPPLLELDALPQVATAFQNEDHREEARLINLATEAVAALPETGGAREAAFEALDTLGRYTREHFEREDDAMRRTAFPPYPVHHAEHQRVLAEFVAMVGAFKAGGAVAPLHHYLTVEVPQWFLAHIQSMDTVTAKWIASYER